TESGLQTSSLAAHTVDLHFLMAPIMIRAHSGHIEMRGERLVKAARPGRSRRRHGGPAYASADAPAPPGQTTPVGWRERSCRAAAGRGERTPGRGGFDKGPSRRLHRAERGQARSQPDRKQAYEPPPLVKSPRPVCMSLAHQLLASDV